jgi:CheY-like chemotaxis protein
MTLSTLLVCAEQAAVDVLRRVQEELGMKVELCSDPARAGVRLAQERFDLIVLDCKKQKDTFDLLIGSRASRLNDNTLAVVVAEGQARTQHLFSLGVNFVVYKPIAYERALSSLRAAQSLLYRDKRRNARKSVHTQATVDYVGGQQIRANLVDLAEDGMAVSFGTKLPPTCKVYFQFQLPGQKSTVRLSGQVVWQDWSGRAGVQFVDVPQTSRRIMSEWLQSNRNDVPDGDTAPPKAGVQPCIQPAEVKILAGQMGKQNGVHERDALTRLHSETHNRRGQDRYACRLGAEVFQAGSPVRNYCHLSDLSPGGCFLEMPLAFARSTAVEITVRTHQIKLRLSGKVRAAHPGIGMGISFMLNTPEERSGVQQLIDFVVAATPSGE